MIKLLKTVLCCVALSGITTNLSAQESREIPSLSFGDQPELLAPEVAFQGQLTLNATGDALNLNYSIEEGYYLYRDRFSVTPSDAGLALGDVQWPQAKIYSDPYFGEPAIYRHSMDATIPIESATSSTAVVEVIYQGCADIGVCFPPTKAVFNLSDLNTARSDANIPRKRIAHLLKTRKKA